MANEFDDIFDPFIPPEKRSYSQILSEYESSNHETHAVPELLKLVEDLLMENENLKRELYTERNKPFVESGDRVAELQMYIRCLDEDISSLQHKNKALSLTGDAHLIEFAKCIKELNYWKEKAEKTNQNSTKGDKNAQT